MNPRQNEGTPTKEYPMAKTYETFGDALADPSSNLSKSLEKWREIRDENNKVIDDLMATGLTGEEAWSIALKSIRPKRVSS